MTTTAIRKTANPLAALPWRVTPTSQLKPGDVFTTDAGYGVLVFASRARSPFSALTAVDLTGETHREVHAGGRVHKLLDLDTLPACDVCEHGCDCEQGQPGCKHFACWGTGTDADTTCLGAVAQRVALYQHLAVRLAAR